MFMRFRGGGVGHKSTRRETSCLLDDRDKLDRVPFQREKERHGSEFDESSEEDEDMDEDEDLEEDGYGDLEGSDDGSEEASDGEEDCTDDEDDEVPVSALFEAMVDDTVADEMDEYGYTGLDQVLDEDGAGEETDNADDFGPEDGEDVIDEFEDGFAEL